jgi:hypothetical protein
MALDVNHAGIAVRKSNPSLIFDTEGVTLIARFSNELAAHRARKNWTSVLSRYFLLERGRDYEVSVISSPETGYNVLNCYFTSACGRYAFWRLINDQAPEAELKLCEATKSIKVDKSAMSQLFQPKPNTPTPWILNAQAQERKTASVKSILPRLLRSLKLWS